MIMFLKQERLAINFQSRFMNTNNVFALHENYQGNWKKTYRLYLYYEKN